MAMARITRALLGDENSVLTVSTLLRGAHGVRGVFAGIPCVVGGAGVRETLTLPLLPEEEERFRRSCEVLDACWKSCRSERKPKRAPPVFRRRPSSCAHSSRSASISSVLEAVRSSLRLMTRAGTPATTTPGSTSPMTTAPAATTAPAPTRTPSMTTALAR